MIYKQTISVCNVNLELQLVSADTDKWLNAINLLFYGIYLFTNHFLLSSYPKLAPKPLNLNPTQWSTDINNINYRKIQQMNLFDCFVYKR